MNHLAHFYLAGDDDHLSVGNYLGDFLRGAEIRSLPDEYTKGLKLHREIDRYTDDHPAVKEGIHSLRGTFGKYASVVIDVYFDHFLAKFWNDHSGQDLQSFADYRYQLLIDHREVLNYRAKRFHQYMTTRNILVRYAELDGIQEVFEGLSYRANFKSNMELGGQVLEREFETFEQIFDQFFPDIVQHIEQIDY